MLVHYYCEIYIAEPSRRKRAAPSCSFGASCNPDGVSGSILGVPLLPCLGGVIDSITPGHGTTNTELTITGSNLLSDPSCISVAVGDYSCDLTGDVTTQNNQQAITCNINTTPENSEPMSIGNHYEVQVSQGEYGLSLINIASIDGRYFYLYGTVSGVSPASGSIGGGNVITITGEGFIDGDTAVTVGGNVCDIRSVDYTSIVCETTAAQAGGSQPIGVRVIPVYSIIKPLSLFIKH